EVLALGRRIRDVVQAPDGAVMALTDEPAGRILRLAPAASQ
ncbi:MAG: PQQ-dependent sugar dehydrogenase, partial [Mesorhizobium sp.]